MKEKHHVVEQLLKEQNHKRDNGPININIDDLWRYSGKIEKLADNYKDLILESTMIRSTKLPTLKSRRDHFRLYWQKQQQNKEHEIQIKKSETERSCQQVG